MTTDGARFLDGADWAGNIFIEGTWRPGSAGEAPIVEPATGEELGRTGRAGVDDVATAAGSAAAARQEWGALPMPAPAGGVPAQGRRHVRPTRRRAGGVERARGRGHPRHGWVRAARRGRGVLRRL